MRAVFFILSVFLSFSAIGQNTIKSIYVPDIARKFVIVTTTASVGVTMPSTTAFEVNATNPLEVIKTNDTTFSLRMNTAFTQGASVSVDYTTPGGGELGSLPSFSSRLANNQIGSGTVRTWTDDDYFLGVGTDFNTTNSCSAGDIYEIPPGTDLGFFDVSLMTGIRFVSGYSATGDSVLLDYFNIREETINSGLFGHPALPYQSIKIRNTYAGNFGIGCFATGDIWFENLEIHHVSQGIQVKTVSDIASPPYNLSRLNYQNLVTRNISVHHCSEEAFYIGSDVAAPLIPITWTGWNLSVAYSGRDAYQYRNGRWVWLKNLTMETVGEEHNLSHSHGFLYGTTTAGGYVENLTGTDIWGNGILVNGYGRLTFKNISLSSKENTVYIKNYDDEDNYNQKGLIVSFICGSNWFDCTTDPGGYSLDVRRDNTKTQVKVLYHSSTTFINPIYIEDGVNGGPDYGIIYSSNTVCRKTGIFD
jgi:hypothetical protein